MTSSKKPMALVISIRLGRNLVGLFFRVCFSRCR